ncbi:MAG TPA: hypothetical protein VML75_10620 [Kofleriaceae bacterium]|nr:hypothetical protein [Kofleriaceae bacterium]
MLAGWLDEDAPVLVRVDLEQWELAVDGYRNSALPGASRTVFLASAGAAALLGFDPLVTAGWFRAGFDGTGMILGSFGAIDHAAAGRLTDAGTGPTPLWRGRMVLSVDDPAAADASMKRLGTLPGVASIEDAAGVAAVVGSAPGLARQLAASLRKLEVRAVAALPNGLGVLFVRRLGAVAVFDILQPFGTERMEWKRDQQAVLAALARTPAGAAGRLTSGAGKSLATEGITVWLDATGSIALATRLENDRLLRAGLASGSAFRRPTVCRQFSELVATGAFDDLSLSLHLSTLNGTKYNRKAQILSRYGLRGAYKLAGRLMVEHDGLGSVSALANSDAAAAATYLRTLEPLRTLPRPALLRGPRRELHGAVTACGSGADLALFAFGWPQYLGMFLDDVASVDAEAAVLVGALRNGLAVLRTASGAGRASWQFGVQASFEPAAQPLLDKYLDLVFAARREVSAPGGSYTVWSQGPLQPFRHTRQETLVYGIASEPALTARLVRGARATSPAASRLLAEALIHPARTLAPLAGEEPLARLLLPLASRFDVIGVRSHLGSDVLETVAAARYH